MIVGAFARPQRDWITALGFEIDVLMTRFVREERMIERIPDRGGEGER